MSPYPAHPMDPNDPDYDPKLDPHNPEYTPNDPRLIGGVSPYVSGVAPKSMSTDEADQYRKSLQKPSSPASSGMSTKEADQYLKQYRAQQGNSKTAPNQVAGGSATPPITGDQAAAPPEDFFHSAYHALPDIVQQHPIIAGIGATAALPLIASTIPEGALTALAGYGLRNIITPLIRYGAGAAGVGIAGDLLTSGKLHETLLPKLIEMASHLGEEGGQ